MLVKYFILCYILVVIPTLQAISVNAWLQDNEKQNCVILPLFIKTKQRNEKFVVDHYENSLSVKFSMDVSVQQFANRP